MKAPGNGTRERECECVVIGKNIGDALDRYFADCVRAAFEDREFPQWPFAALAQGQASEPFLDLLSQRAEFHGIGLLLARCRDAFADWPRPAAEAIKALAHRGVFEEELSRRPIAALIDRLAQAGVASRMLKGSAVAYLAYPDPAARPRGDTDILIAPRDLPATRQILQADGWSRQPTLHAFPNQECWTINCGAGLVHTLDLHWRTSNRAMLRRLLPVELFWADARPLPRLATAAAAPDPVLLLLHGAVNQMWHEYRGFYLGEELLFGQRRLIWSMDQALICAHFDSADWDRLVSICVSHDAGAIVHAALSGAVTDIGLRVPEGVLSRLNPHASQSGVLNYIRNPLPGEELRADLAASENLAMRARLLWSAAFASRSHLIGKYPQAAHWPTLALQVRRYVDAFSRTATRRAQTAGVAPDSNSAPGERH